MDNIGYAKIEAIGLKLCALEKEAIYAKDDKENSEVYAQIKALRWVVSLLGIVAEVNEVRQKQTELNNKTFEAGEISAKESSNE